MTKQNAAPHHIKSHFNKKNNLIISLFLLYLLAAIPTPGLTDEGICYQIGSGDVLEISVWKEESLSREIIVPPDLTIAFPLIGEIKIKGMTVSDLRCEVTKRLNDFIPEATVTVMLHQINSLRAYVIGKVNKPGQFPIDLDTTVMQLLAMAGGLNPFAATGKIYILRHQEGKMIKIPFDYREVEKGKNLAQNITIRRGDVIIVP
ncbi:MAG: polysaccharide biosynthesis/export family protein [Deltaproteobacteria bacterium]|nr:polysaccharide biosynthesis/export family protein [Candidatus Tharpella aukensis]